MLSPFAEMKMIAYPSNPHAAAEPPALTVIMPLFVPAVSCI